jgi:hypothetical protein
MVMPPHGNNLMVSTPLNPLAQMSERTSKGMRSPKKEIKDFTNVLFA